MGQRGTKIFTDEYIFGDQFKHDSFMTKKGSKGKWHNIKKIFGKSRAAVWNSGARIDRLKKTITGNRKDGIEYISSDDHIKGVERLKMDKGKIVDWALENVTGLSKEQ